MPKPFKNPYLDLEDTARLQADVSRGDYNFIRCCRVQQGTITTVIGILWKKLCDELRKQGITDYSRGADFEDFVANCELVHSKELDSLYPNEPVKKFTRKTTKPCPTTSQLPH